MPLSGRIGVSTNGISHLRQLSFSTLLCRIIKPRLSIKPVLTGPGTYLARIRLPTLPGIAGLNMVGLKCTGYCPFASHRWSFAAGLIARDVRWIAAF